MPSSDVFAVVLAAGGASRFGGDKLLQVWRGQPLAAHALRAAEAVCGSRSVLVTGSQWRGVFDACTPLAGFLVCNPGWRSGIGGSIAVGVEAVRHAAEAVVIMLADQPLVTAEHVTGLIARWHRAPGRIVATAFAGVLGPPVLFPAGYMAQLAGLSGDRGARSVIGHAGAQVESIAFEAAAADVDRPEDLRRLP